MTYSLSTSWNSSKHDNGYDIVREIRAAGFDTIELNFSLTEKVVNDILALQKAGEIKISSIHNMCPLPKEIEPEEASPDYYSLASSDEEERHLAVEVAANTIQWAKRLGARAVVLHIGRIQIKDRTRDLAEIIGDRPKFEELKRAVIKERTEKKNGYLDNAIRSLEELITQAAETGISLGIENRFYYREIPQIDELEVIFDHFGKGELYYWHDVGHAQVFENLTFARHEDFLRRFSNRLLGIHLHDIIYPIRDHQTPGSGTFDFSRLKSYLTPDTIKVIEAHQPATADELKKARGFLSRILG